MASAPSCPWCHLPLPAGQVTCPHCGAPVDVRIERSESGWAEMPPVRDMARIQFGQSTCQIEGAYVPVADCNLAADDWVYFTHHVLLWRDPSVTIEVMKLGGWRRLLAGMPLIMTSARGPGHIAFSRDAAGEMVALPPQPGVAVDVREGHFLVATGAVSYQWFQTGVWFVTGGGNEREWHYPLGQFMDRFTAPERPGLLLVHAPGNVFIRTLRPGETMLIKPTALLFKDPSVSMGLHLEYPGNTTGWGRWANRYLWLLLQGPGRVAVHSAYEFIEDNGGSIVNMSPATQQQW